MTKFRNLGLWTLWVCLMSSFLYCGTPQIVKKPEGQSVKEGVQTERMQTTENASNQEAGRKERVFDANTPPDPTAQDTATPDEGRDPDLPPGRCRKDRDCKRNQICEQGKCFADCVNGAVCFTGDVCDPKRKRCVCKPSDCKAASGFCSREELCRTSCKSDDACVAGERCIEQFCRKPSPEPGPEPDVKPPSYRKRGQSCGIADRCEPGLLCVNLNVGGRTCLKPCKDDTNCQAPERCRPNALADGTGLCGTFQADGQVCDTAKSLLCRPGFRCRNGKCSQRNRVGVFDQCDLEHLCTPSSLVCVSFGKIFGDLCLKPCKVGQAGACSLSEICVDPSGGKNGICLAACKKPDDKCPTPFLRCNQIGSGQLVCVPQGNTTVNKPGDPCGGAYGTCAQGSACYKVFARSGIGVCASACKADKCDAGFQCIQPDPKATKACYRTCTGPGASCPKGFVCTPVGTGWMCVP